MAAVRKAADGTASVSLYHGDAAAAPAEIAQAMARLKAAFPRMTTDFFGQLAERLVANDYSAQRLRDAVDHLIDTHPYGELRVADVIGFDRTARLYTYAEVSAMVTSGRAEWNEFEVRDVGGTPYRVRRTDNRQ